MMNTRTWQSGRFFLGLVLLPLLSGCGIQPKATLGHWDGPQMLSSAQVEQWSFGSQPARRLKSPHYIIYTTITDEDLQTVLTQVMEGALAQYNKVASGVARSEAPMECYIFQRRSEWETFTKANVAKRDAKIFLQIRRGGYALGDKYVAYYIGRGATASVAAHEGWHQYVARHFIGRLPPFLEEGLACMFEGVSWKNETLPRWNLSINLVRVQALRKSIETHKLWPLEKVIAMHAGEVVEENGEKVDAFYAQAWCFARFLYESDHGRFRANLQRWLAETANGTVYDPTGSHRRSERPWDRRGIKPMVEHYLNLDFPTIDKLYREYLRKVAYDEYSAQWSS